MRTPTLEQKAPDDGDDIEQREDDHVLARVVVRTEQHQKAHARAHERAGHERAEPEHALQIELRDDHARCAVGDEAHERAREHRQRGVRGQEVGKRVLPHRLEHRHEHERHDEDEDADLDGVRQRAAHDRPHAAMRVVVPAVMARMTMPVLMLMVVVVRMPGIRATVAVIAPAVVVLTQKVDPVGRLASRRHLVDQVLTGTRPLGGPTRKPPQGSVDARAAAQRTQTDIDQKARHRRDGRLGKQDEGKLARVGALGQKHGQHLVGGRQEHAHERAERDDAAGVECGRHGGKPALRHDAEQCAHHGPGGAGTTYRVVHALARRMLEHLEYQIRHQQKRHERQRVLPRVQDEMGYIFHGATLPFV